MEEMPHPQPEEKVARRHATGASITGDLIDEPSFEAPAVGLAMVHAQPESQAVGEALFDRVSQVGEGLDVTLDEPTTVGGERLAADQHLGFDTGSKPQLRIGRIGPGV